MAGGHLGRFIIWTEGAFKQLDSVFGTAETESEQKKGYKLPTAKMSNSDLTSIINSDEIRARKKNPLRNFGFMVKLNPYAIPARRAELLRSAPGVKRTASDAENAAKANRAKKGVAAKKRRTSFYTQLQAPVK